MAHDVANEFMKGLPGGPEVIKPNDLQSILKDFHYNIEKVKYLINKNQYLELRKIRDAAIEWKNSYFQRKVCWNETKENLSDIANQNLNEALTKLREDWEHLWLVLQQFLDANHNKI